MPKKPKEMERETLDDGWVFKNSTQSWKNPCENRSRSLHGLTQQLKRTKLTFQRPYKKP